MNVHHKWNKVICLVQRVRRAEVADRLITLESIMATTCIFRLVSRRLKLQSRVQGVNYSGKKRTEGYVINLGFHSSNFCLY